ncbi:MAG: signal peptidase II [Chloroflexi bacterium]|nr:signal peptidase II [Chloroflexota bacterium]
MNKLMRGLNKAWVILLVAGMIILLDKLSKDWVRQTIPLNSYKIPIPSLGEYFVFEHVNNYGAAFGILQNQGYLFVGIAVIVVVAILLYARYLPLDQWFVRVLLGLQLGGAVGNLLDRINQGFVTDFVKMGIPGRFYWPNYNIADSSIVLGVLALGVYIMWDDLRKQRETKSEPPVAENVNA